MAQRAVRIGEQLGAPAQQLLPEIFDLQRIHELLVVLGTIVWWQNRAHRSPQTPVQDGGGVYESGSPDSTVNAAIHRVDSARFRPSRTAPQAGGRRGPEARLASLRRNRALGSAIGCHYGETAIILTLFMRN